MRLLWSEVTAVGNMIVCAIVENNNEGAKAGAVIGCALVYCFIRMAERYHDIEP